MFIDVLIKLSSSLSELSNGSNLFIKQNLGNWSSRGKGVEEETRRDITRTANSTKTAKSAKTSKNRTFRYCVQT